MHSRTPMLMLAQRGSAWPQSAHSSLPGNDCTRCRMVSTPLMLRSRDSLADSMLLVDGEAVRSSRYGDREIEAGSVRGPHDDL